MKKNRILSLFLLMSVMLSLMLTPAAAWEQPDLQCRNAILMDAAYGEVLYEKKGYDKAYPASTTKVMTALLVMEALESGKLAEDTMITAGDTALQGLYGNYSTAGIKVGETMSVRELLFCLMLPSANEAANILAVAVDGSIEDFVDHMNQRAGELGCQGTHFTNPHGMHDDDHYTTAYDIALQMQAALKYDLFREIIGTAKHTVPATNMADEKLFYNTNGLLSNFYYANHTYDKCIGGKTGSTEEAGRCLVAAAKDGEEELISVVLGSGPIKVEGYADLRQGQFDESKRILQWGFSNFERTTITKGSDPVATVAVTLSRQTDEVMVKPQGSITRTLPKDLDLDQIETEISLISPTVEAPVKAGQVLGVMKLSYEGETYGTLDLVAVTSVERSELLYKKAQFISFFQNSGVKLALGVVLLLGVVVLLKLVVFKKKRRYGAGVGARSRGNYRGGRR